MAAKKQLMLKNVVLSFPNLAEPQAFGKGEPAYGAKFPIVPNSEQQKLIGSKNQIEAVTSQMQKRKAEFIDP